MLLSETLVSVGAEAGPYDYSLKLENVTGATVLVIGAWKVDGVQGWSYGVCHDADCASIGSCGGAVGPVPDPCDNPTCPDVRCPRDMAGPGPNGETAAFHLLNVYANGLTQAVVLDFKRTWDIPRTERFELLDITYSLKAGWVSCDLSICNTLGDPPVDVQMTVAGLSNIPGFQEGTRVPNGPCPLQFNLQLAAGDQETVTVVLDTVEDQPVSGFQFGIRHDDPEARVIDIAPGAAFGDAGIDVVTEGFWGVTIIEGQGATLGCVVDLAADGGIWRTLPACRSDQEVALATFGCRAGAPETMATAIAIAGDLGAPPVAIVVDVDGTSLVPDVGGPVNLTFPCEEITDVDFRRGDANQDGFLNVSDAVAIARAVFGAGNKLPLIQGCMDSADADDDGAITTADAVYLCHYLYLGGPSIPAPLGSCGQDPNADDLRCSEFDCP
jgi:hypothetical protein